MSLTKQLRQLLHAVRQRGMAPRTLCVHLAPHQLRAAVRQGQRLIDGSQQQIALANPSGHWQSAVDALHALLLQARGDAASAAAGAMSLAGLPLEISLSSRWQQLAIVPWSDALLSEPAAHRFLQMQLAALYGDAALGWRIVADDAPYGHARAICGIDSALLQALNALADASGHPCHAIEPALGAALRWLPRTSTGTGASARSAPGALALALAEPGRLTLAAITRGRISALHTQPSNADWSRELPQAWQRWLLRMPELAGIPRVTVINLAAPPATALPQQFELADDLYGAAPATLIEAAA